MVSFRFSSFQSTARPAAAGLLSMDILGCRILFQLSTDKPLRISKLLRGCSGQYRQDSLHNRGTLLEKTGAEEQKDTQNGYCGEEGRKIIVLHITVCVQVKAGVPPLPGMCREKGRITCLMQSAVSYHIKCEILRAH